MADKGVTRWEVSKTDEREESIGIQRYALRTDGKLISCWAVYERNGSVRYNFGWKIAERRMQPILPEDAEKRLASFIASGYVVTSNTPNPQPLGRPRRTYRSWPR